MLYSKLLMRDKQIMKVEHVMDVIYVVTASCPSL